MQRTARKQGRAGVAARARYLSCHPLCEHCSRKGLTRAADEVDHILPLHKGGKDTDDNKQALCSPCHRAKTAQDMGYTQRGCDINGDPIGASHHWNR